MDTSSLERFALAARHALEDGVAQRLYTLALDDDGRREFPAGSDVVRGRVLSNRERRWRDDLVRAVGEEGLAAFSARMAYTWFNRLLAIRYMEVHGFLPCRMRMFSDAGGAFEPEVLARPFEVEIAGVSSEEVSALVASGDDEALLRCFLLAQVSELAATMPQVFGEVGAAESLTLPDNLLSQGDANAVYLAVRDLPEHPVDAEGEPLESVWWPKDEDVDADPTEILGWLYQFYNAEARAEYKASKRKASKEDLPVATQLFTPRWIVRYLVENSLGRLWVQGRPGSPLLGAMPYYIAPEEEPSEVAVASPEDITLLDPAMGSGHMLGYAFELLCTIYREAGYRDRDVPALILEKNLSGFEVDPRAAQIAAFRLLMLGRERDRRLLSRGVAPRTTVFTDVVFPEGSLQMTALEDDPNLLDLLGHLGEVGSLWQPSEAQVGALRTTLAQLDGDDALEAIAREGVERALSYAEALTAEFDVLVTNPPYLGSKHFNPWLGKWVKKHYPNANRDLCTCFMERAYGLADRRGYVAMVTMQSWMFNPAFVRMRNEVIDHKAIVSMAHLGTRAFDAIGGKVVNTTAFVLKNSFTEESGAYVRLVDEVGEAAKRDALLEAICNPDCGWFNRAAASRFHEIPGSPISYWVNSSLYEIFDIYSNLGSEATVGIGLQTGDNERFVRHWWEIETSRFSGHCSSAETAINSGARWFPYCKGGKFRKWYGNGIHVVNWENDGIDIRKETKNGAIVSSIRNTKYYFLPIISWSMISDEPLSLRKYRQGFVTSNASGFIVSSMSSYIEALCNSSAISAIMNLMSTTHNNNVGQLKMIPVIYSCTDMVQNLALECESISQSDWDLNETSLGFFRNELI